MIELYYWPTPNGWKAAIMLEEIGAEYEIKPVDIGAGEQFSAEFLAISPNNRMPAIVDRQPSGGGGPLAVFESGAILEYLADKSGQFLAPAGRERSAALQWVHWQTANLGPMMGNVAHFKFYAPGLTGEGVDHSYAASRFLGEVDRLAGVIDARLHAARFLGGSSYGIADIFIRDRGYNELALDLDRTENSRQFVLGDVSQREALA
jgi:GSH-dependent disulfide-bond oxidoreductase